MSEQQSVQIGNKVALILIDRDGNKEHLTLIIVDDALPDIETGTINFRSPLATAILGEKVGTVIPYFSDDIQAVQIISISQPSDLNSHPKRSKRKSLMKDILNQINFRDAKLFAGSSDTKWGSYDPDSLNYNSWMGNDPDNSPEEPSEMDSE